MFRTSAGGLIVAAALVAIPAHAGTFVLTSPSNSALSGTAGNSVSRSSDGITMVATAWSTSGLANTALPTAAYLGTYVNGLGVTNVNEGNGTSYNSHTIDNVVSYDFVKLTFSQAVTLTGISLYGYDVDGRTSTPIDTDAWVSFGTNGFATADAWQTYLGRGIAVASGTGLSTDKVGTVWLVGAARSSSDRNDGFKLSSITAVAAPGVPEPATWMTMIAGFGFIGGMMRRRTARTAAATA